MDLRSLLSERDPRAVLLDERRQIGMGQAWSHLDVGVEPVRVAVPARLERDDDVRVALLGPDVDLGVALPAVELGQHRIGRVAAS